MPTSPEINDVGITRRNNTLIISAVSGRRRDQQVHADGTG